MRKLAYFAAMALAASVLFMNCAKNDFSATPSAPGAGPNSSPTGTNPDSDSNNTDTTQVNGQGAIDSAAPTGRNGTPGALSQGNAANGNIAGNPGATPVPTPVPDSTPPPESTPVPGATPVPGGTVGTYGGGVPQEQAPLQLPTITYYAPKCKAGDWCPVTFRISGGGATLTYNWSTNDKKFGEAAPAGLAPYGRAGVDYVSTYGSMTWEAGGQDAIKIYIHDISTQASEITIPLLFTDCVYAGHAINCTDLKFTGVQQ